MKETQHFSNDHLRQNKWLIIFGSANVDAGQEVRILLHMSLKNFAREELKLVSHCS